MNRLIDFALQFENIWLEPLPGNTTDARISIVIPVYYPDHLDDVLTHLFRLGGFHEIILVDDSGCFDTEKDKYSKWRDRTKIIFHYTNQGRPATRNTGAAFASGDLLLFMDQDMFLAPNLVASARRYYANNSLIFLGLRETVPFHKIPDLDNWTTPDPAHDWRIQTNILPTFLDLTVTNVGNANNHCNSSTPLRICEETDHLRKLGVYPDKTIGFWDLPSMVVSHSIIIEKNIFFQLGGFPEWIRGWGGEDTALGFLACAKHIPIFLSDCVSYQAYHEPFSGSEEKRIAELTNNISAYRKWATTITKYPVFPRQEIVERSMQWN